MIRDDLVPLFGWATIHLYRSMSHSPLFLKKI